MKTGEVLFGKYEVREKIGAGGMGEVRKARDTVAGIDVAIKTVPREVAADETAMQRVKDEFLLAKKLSHENIVVLRDLQRDPESGAYFIVEDFVEGMNLDAYRRSKPGKKVPVEDAVRIAAEIASALDFAHRKNVVHRDVKPENVMVTAAGKVLLTDFGIGTEIRTSYTTLSKTRHDTSGTRPYMAPERWTPGQREDGTTDQWALAVVFHQLVCRRPPFQSSDLDVLKSQILHDEPSRVQELSRAQNAALKKALAKKSAERHTNCASFVAALRGERKPIGRGVAAALAAVLVVIGVALGVAGYERWRAARDIGSAVERLARGIRVPAGKVVAMAGFVDRHTGEKQALGNEIEERLTTALMQRGDRVVERARLAALEDELKVQTDWRQFGAKADKTLDRLLDTLSEREGANLILTGTFIVEEEHVRIDARLVDLVTALGAAASSVEVERTERIAALAPPSVATRSRTKPITTYASPQVVSGALVTLVGLVLLRYRRPLLAWARIGGGPGTGRAPSASPAPSVPVRPLARKTTAPVREQKPAPSPLEVPPLSELPSFPELEEPRAPVAEAVSAQSGLPQSLVEWDEMEMLLVPAGEFVMGSDKGAEDEKPRHKVYLDDYYIAKHPITNAQYAAFVKETGSRKPDYWSDSSFNDPNQPAVGVSWDDMVAFCKWLSRKTGNAYRLPTEAEWEKAARGTDEREYPWGNEEPDRTLACFALGTEQGKPDPVGSNPKGVSPYGCHDMAGNVWEWCWDWYDSSYYARSDRSNPRGPDGGSGRVRRGGGWRRGDPRFLRVANRGGRAPGFRGRHLGFRLARTP